MSGDQTGQEERFAELQIALAGTWSLEREIGRGGMGTVYLARDVALERPVAIKVLNADLSRDQQHREQLLREARTGARLSHPHIVPIYAVETAADSVYIVMGLVDGESLRERIFRDGPLPYLEAIRVLREIGWALGYAHAMGTLHRDVTLDNILMDRRTGRAQLADFGIAAEIGREDAGPLVGTPAYIAPELIQGQPASPATDLYALGITAWAMLSGRLPFQDEDNAKVLLSQLTEPIPSLAEAAPATPSRLVRAVEAALQKDPSARPGSIETWLNLLEEQSKHLRLAGPLEQWTDQWRHVKAFYAVALSVIAMYALDSGQLMGWYGWLTIRSFLILASVPLALAWMVDRTINIRSLKRVAKAGYRIEDLRLALRGFLEPIFKGHAPLRNRTPTRVRRATWASLAIYVGSMTMMVFFSNSVIGEKILHRHGPWPWWYDFMESTAGVLLAVIKGSLAGFWLGLGLQVILPSEPTRIARWRAKLRLAFWDSALGAQFFRLAAGKIDKTIAPEHTLHRPTELVLDLEIEDLWAALPNETRAALADIPRLARSLRGHIAELREFAQKLDSPNLLGAAGVTEIRTRLAKKQEAGLNGLEGLRMLLCRLGGVAGPDSELTEQLHALRNVEGDLLEELGTHVALRKMLRGRRRTGITPELTPA